MNALLQPIRRVQPFNLVCGDYLSLPAGIGNFKTLGVYIDTCSNFIWASKFKDAGTNKTTISSLQGICLDYATPGTFMSDGGSHFKNRQVSSFCEENNIKHIITAAYAPWVNGLVENTNKLILNRLKRLCSPDLDETPGDVDPKSIPRNWPKHLAEAIRSLNDRVIPALNATPREILFGMALRPDTQTTNPIAELLPTTNNDLDTHFTLADSFRYTTHLRSIKEADRRKNIFDSKAQVPNIKTGDLVQFYDSKADYNYSTINKLAPRWSVPHLVTGEYLNSYTLSTLHGLPLSGLFHIRRLRPYTPLRGTTLDLIHPWDIPEPTEEDLAIAEAEERMAEEDFYNPFVEHG
jgi:transposase InsO family protein